MAVYLSLTIASALDSRHKEESCISKKQVCIAVLLHMHRSPHFELLPWIGQRLFAWQSGMYRKVVEYVGFCRSVAYARLSAAELCQNMLVYPSKWIQTYGQEYGFGLLAIKCNELYLACLANMGSVLSHQ